MKPTDITASPELLKKAQEFFQDSLFVMLEGGDLESHITLRSDWLEARAGMPCYLADAITVIPAPTLQEILLAIPGGALINTEEKCVESLRYDYEPGEEPVHEHWDEDGSMAEAAMRLLLRLKSVQ